MNETRNNEPVPRPVGINPHIIAEWDRIKQIRENFLATGNDRGEIRPEILDAWKRSQQYGIVPLLKASNRALSKHGLETRIAMNAELLEVALPVMHKLYEFVKGSGFVVLLADNDGFILSEIGDTDMLERTRTINATIGYSLNEKVIGANAVGTALVIDKPVQYFGYEHWCVCTQVGTCSAAPIHDPDSGKLVGVLNLTGMWDKVSHHTLGLVVSGVGWIENKLSNKRNIVKAWMAEDQKSMIMEAVSEGLIAIDENGLITYANWQAKKLFGIQNSKNIIGCLFTRVIGEKKNNRQLLSLLVMHREIKDEMISFENDSGKLLQLVISSCELKGYNGANIGRVFIFQDFARVNKIVRKLSSGTAITTFEKLIGRNTIFQECINKAKQAANTSSNVFLLGESGTGKDLFAQAIHNASRRSKGPFIAVNCAAIPHELLASELFGYEEGAFTGAKRGGSVGKFELASSGTIFLDEIGEMPTDMQTSLLRLIEERSVRRIGGERIIPIDIRIIAATNRDIKELIAAGKFRLDLFYRLNVVNIQLPSLRARKEDIPLLADSLLQKICDDRGKNMVSYSEGVMAAFMTYEWPGNIRELHNVIEGTMNMCTGSEIKLDLLPSEITTNYFERGDAVQDICKLKNMEDALVNSYLNKYSSNKSMTAKKLGISRSTLYRKLKKTHTH